MHAEPSHLYVHVPFCSAKCSYCVLYSVDYDEFRATRYVAALGREMDTWFRDRPLLQPETVFIGGGTPSILDDRLFERLLGQIRARLDLSRLQEWTLEAQPGTLNEAKLAMMRAVGINRVSMGVQALHDATLRRVLRRHDVADVENSLACVRRGGIDNVGIDLIACLPGVKSEEWRGTLRHAADLGLRHVSVYALTIEPGSRLGAQVERGEHVPANDDTQIGELDAAESILGAAGFQRYEFSNYAKPGMECLHNLATWRGRDYISFGPAAASRVGLERWTNAPDVNGYITCAERGEEPRRHRDTLSVCEDTTERLVFGFRLSEGVDVEAFGRGDPDLARHWQTTLGDLLRQGVVERLGKRWRLTSTGRLYADSVAEALIPVSRVEPGA